MGTLSFGDCQAVVAGWPARVVSKVNHDLLDLDRGDALVRGTLKMAPELVVPSLSRKQGNRDHTAVPQAQARSAPNVGEEMIDRRFREIVCPFRFAFVAEVLLVSALAALPCRLVMLLK